MTEWSRSAPFGSTRAPGRAAAGRSRCWPRASVGATTAPTRTTARTPRCRPRRRSRPDRSTPRPRRDAGRRGRRLDRRGRSPTTRSPPTSSPRPTRRTSTASSRAAAAGRYAYDIELRTGLVVEWVGATASRPDVDRNVLSAELLTPPPRRPDEQVRTGQPAGDDLDARRSDSIAACIEPISPAGRRQPSGRGHHRHRGRDDDASASCSSTRRPSTRSRSGRAPRTPPRSARASPRSAPSGAPSASPHHASIGVFAALECHEPTRPAANTPSAGSTPIDQSVSRAGAIVV